MAYDRFAAIDENNEFPPEIEVVNRTGDTMTGPLILANAPAAALGATTKQYVDSADALLAPKASPAFTGSPTAPTPSTGDSDTSIATTAFVNAEIVNDAVLKSGSTMTGKLTLSGAPTSTNHAATKAYVDGSHHSYKVAGATAGYSTNGNGDVTIATGLSFCSAAVATVWIDGTTGPVWTAHPVARVSNVNTPGGSFVAHITRDNSTTPLAGNPIGLSWVAYGS